MTDWPKSTATFDDLPDHARLWIFGVSRALDEEEERLLQRTVDAFLSQWSAHGRPLAAARDWREGRFLMVALNPDVEPPSGCSIDALIRALRELEAELGVEMVGSAPVWFRGAEGGVERVSRARFRELASTGVVGPETPVFDLSLTVLSELRANRFEGVAAERWHARLLG
jgi:hypothetical protein